MDAARRRDPRLLVRRARLAGARRARRVVSQGCRVRREIRAALRRRRRDRARRRVRRMVRDAARLARPHPAARPVHAQHLSRHAARVRRRRARARDRGRRCRRAASTASSTATSAGSCTCRSSTPRTCGAASLARSSSARSRRRRVIRRSARVGARSTRGDLPLRPLSASQRDSRAARRRRRKIAFLREPGRASDEGAGDVRDHACDAAYADRDAVLGLLGGTFDPVHYGHLGLADDVRRALGLPEVRLVPAGDPPHRGGPAASGRDRVAMLELAMQAIRPGSRRARG